MDVFAMKSMRSEFRLSKNNRIFSAFNLEVIVLPVILDFNELNEQLVFLSWSFKMPTHGFLILAARVRALYFRTKLGSSDNLSNKKRRESRLSAQRAHA